MYNKVDYSSNISALIHYNISTIDYDNCIKRVTHYAHNKARVYFYSTKLKRIVGIGAN